MWGFWALWAIFLVAIVVLVGPVLLVALKLFHRRPRPLGTPSNLEGAVHTISTTPFVGEARSDGIASLKSLPTLPLHKRAYGPVLPPRTVGGGQDEKRLGR